MSLNDPSQAPELQVSEWLNTQTPLSLGALRGRVVVMEAFQMLCPGCIQGGLPQLACVQESFPDSDVAVLGLHTVFEHHEAQGSRAALAAFLHEFHYRFPTAIDRQPPEGAGRALPLTMAAYAMQGTPTLVLIDRLGRLRRQIFGHVADMRLGAEIMALVRER